MWKEFKEDWDKASLIGKIMMILLYPPLIIIGFIIAFCWNAWGMTFLIAVGIALLSDDMTPQEILVVAAPLATLIQLIKMAKKGGK